MFFCIVTDYYPRGSLDAYLNIMHIRRQSIAESVSYDRTITVVNSMVMIMMTFYSVCALLCKMQLFYASFYLSSLSVDVFTVCVVYCFVLLKLLLDFIVTVFTFVSF